MKGLVFLVTLMCLALYNRICAYQVRGMKSDVLCGDIRFTVQCICNELGYFPTKRQSKPCPWPNREKRSAPEDEFAFEDYEDEDYFHPRALSIPSEIENGNEKESDAFSILSRGKREIAFYQECCNIRTEHKCNRTTVSLYCRRY
uniref:Androgenic hormone n=1 Tax=Armadillidium depressum TaxID=986713 RepID=H9NNE3_9CRUS|nr:androgenic hormone [Armadillidium depressum]